jgi:hypothetical protein
MPFRSLWIQTLKEILATGAYGLLPKSKGGDDLSLVRTLLETENSSSAAATH